MKKIIAFIIRSIFRIKPLQKHFYGFYKRIILPFNLFKELIIIQKIEGITYLLHLDDWIQQQLYILGKYEEAERKAIEKSLHNHAIILDIGTNFGLYSLTLAHQFPKSKIYSFEPFHLNFNTFKKNISLNSLDNITAIKKAVGNKNDTITLYYDESNQNLGMVSAIPNGNTTTSEQVDLITIDTFIEQNNLSNIDFIKIDVEGFELDVLEGMKKSLQHFSPILLLEINDEKSLSTQKTIALLQSFNYKRYFINNDGSISTEINSNPQRKNYLFMK